MPSTDLAAFVSYSREDTKFVLRLARDLKAAGTAVWLDQLDIKAGEPWDRTVEQALSDSSQILLILSPASVRSENVRDEVSFALNKGKAVIPVMYRDCEIPLRLQRAQFVDFRTNYAHAFSALTARLQDREQIIPVDSPLITRRRLLVAGGGVAIALAAGCWLEREHIEYFFAPLPAKRFVALLAWPAGDSPAVVATVLRTIGDRLARAEALDRTFLSIAPADLRDNPTGATIGPVEAATALGVNLVLGASTQVTKSTVTLNLQVLEAATQRLIRKKSINLPVSRISELSEAGPAAAAALLSLPTGQAPLKDEDELQHVTPQVFQLFSDAEQLAAQPNGTGLEAAISKYQQVVDADTHFALGFARLAMAYVQQYRGSKDPGKSDLAAKNADLAHRCNPDSAKALLAQALVSLYCDKKDTEKTNALNYFKKCLDVDPGNPEAFLYEAQAYRYINQPDKAEQAYLDILRTRPNFWPAYNELGWFNSRRGDNNGAALAFQSAAAAAPQVALPLANLGSVYLKLGKHDEAIAACTESLKRSPNYAAYSTLGDIAFSDKKYSVALDDYQRASLLSPNSDTIWRDIGDCYSVLGDPTRVKENYAKAAQLLAAKAAANSKSKSLWATLAFYHAKLGDRLSAENDLLNVGPIDQLLVADQLFIIQAYVLLGRKEEAMTLLLAALDKGLTPSDVDLSLDLRDLQKDPKYIARVHQLQSKDRANAS